MPKGRGFGIKNHGHIIRFFVSDNLQKRIQEPKDGGSVFAFGIYKGISYESEICAIKNGGTVNQKKGLPFHL
jgi:hypothetical protein